MYIPIACKSKKPNQTKKKKEEKEMYKTPL